MKPDTIIMWLAVKNAPARTGCPEAPGLWHLSFRVENIKETIAELHE